MLQVIKKNPYIIIIIYSNAKYYKLIIFLLITTYFLNPMFQYSKQFSHNPEIKIGLKEVIKRLEPDLDRQAKALNEVQQ